jgi:uncharacterized membrane protein
MSLLPVGSLTSYGGMPSKDTILLRAGETRVTIAWLLILFFILLLPANIYAALKHVDCQKGTFEGSGVQYLWFRVPLQVLLIVWTYFFIISTAGLKIFKGCIFP